MHLKNKAKRILAGLLAFCMAFGGIQTTSGITAYAATEIDNTKIEDGHNDNTIWANLSNGARFDLVGIKKSGVYDYEKNNTNVLQTTFNFNGYHTYLNNTTQNTGKITYQPNEGAYNGGVMKFNQSHARFPNMEVSVKTNTSPDGQYVFVDYYILNNNSVEKTMYIGTTADVQIGDDDGANLSKTSGSREGFYMVNGNTGTDAMATFECITDDPSLGIKGNEWGVKRWIGAYSSRYNCNHKITKPDAYDASYSNVGYENFVFKENLPDFKSSQDIKTDAMGNPNEYLDSAFAYSWKVDVRPNEIAHRRVAYTVRPTSYYVSSSRGANDSSKDGSYAKPFATIDYAMNKLNGKRGYIYIMDYGEIAAPITVPTGSGTDITILSSNFNENGETIDTVVDLTRAAAPTGPMFKVIHDNSKLSFNKINLDGNNVVSSYPLVQATNGSVSVDNGAILKNNKVNDATAGSALDITGSAVLSINSGEITDNTSAGKGAVNFNGSKFLMSGNVKIKDNKNEMNVDSNVYLAVNKHIIVSDKVNSDQTTLSGEVYVTTETVPAVGSAVKVVDNAGSPVDVSMFITNFKPDAGSTSGIYMTVDASDNIVLKSDGLELGQLYVDENGNSIAHLIDTVTYPDYAASKMVSAGAAIDELVIPIDGYDFQEATLEPSTGHNMAVVTVGSDKKLQGTMPGQTVIATYKYKKKSSTIKFETYGATSQPTALTGNIGDPVSGLMPTVARYGYEFKGWYKEADVSGTRVMNLPATYPDGDITYYAKWEVSSNTFFDYTVRYVNNDESQIFQSTTTSDTYYIGSPILAQKKTVPGYNLTLKNVNPATYLNEFNDITAPISVGSFDGSDNFSGNMPDQAAVVTYQYSVDMSNTFNFTVKHVSDSGVVLGSTTVQKHPEDYISASPQSFYGFDYVGNSAAFVTGDTASDPASSTVIMGIIDTFGDNFDTNGNLVSMMPNQDVEIVYTYNSDGSGFKFRVAHQYNGSGASDLAAGDDLIPTTSTPKEAGEIVTAQAENIYGYTFADAADTDPASYQADFDGAYNFSANMPSDSLAVTYKYTTDASLWDHITYKAGANGTLNNTNPVHPNVSGGSGTYQAYILINDGSVEGNTNSYTWSQIKAKDLIPNAIADNYYIFDQWYIDANTNGSLDSGEEILASQQFSGPVTLTANFVEKPDEWIDINYAADVNGSISGPAACHIPFDKTWGDIPSYGTYPVPAPEVNYLNDGWYDGSSRVQSSTPLVNGKTYLFKFKKDPVIWGLPVNEPEATGMLETDGSGKIIVHEVSEDYQYVIVDESGKIVAVKPGNDTGSLTFPDLYPGTEYEVYEVGRGENVTPGSPITTVADKSDPKTVLVPVLEDNYTVNPDPAEDGKVTIIVNPADKDSKYAVIDENDNVVMVPDADGDGWVNPKGNNPSIVEFPGLDPNKEYTVVAVPKETTGTDPADRIDKGTTIITDPGVELVIPTYIVETIRGTITEVDGQSIGLDRYDQIEKGQLVRIEAEPTDGAGNSFKYWNVIIGSIPGVSGKVTTLDLEFAMPETNIVIAAYYEKSSISTPSNATVVDEVRGGNSNEMAVNPNEIENLESILTTDKDRELMDQNGAKITYMIIFDKNRAKSDEKAAIKSDSLYDTGVDKELAFTTPWALDVRLERYVDGRRVDRATPSDASFNAIVQLEDEDIDMLDYQLYEITRDGSGNITGLSLVQMVDLPEENGGVGGLFHFDGEIGGRYVLVYSKSFWVKFFNNNYVQNDTYKYKVRKHYAINDSDYISDYDMIWDTPQHEFDDNDGVHHVFSGWSTKKMPDSYKYYDPDRSVEKPLILYAYYENNIKEVQDARDKLEELLDKLLEIADEYFLTKAEKAEIINTVKDAQDKINQTNPRANLEELLTMIDEANNVIEYYEPILDARKEEYDDQHTSGNSSSGSGGSGSGGGSGRGTISKPFVPKKIHSYTVGVNGKWEQLDESGKRWSFTLNGGTHLQSMWAWLEYTGENDSLTGWYHFDSKGEMNYGWFRDEASNWYYCNSFNDGKFGMMKIGWHYDPDDKHWYYLDSSGAMATGWREISGVWYYFTASNYQETYTYNPTTERWSYLQNSARPLGSMYVSEVTPDGYRVDANGAWTR